MGRKGKGKAKRVTFADTVDPSPQSSNASLDPDDCRFSITNVLAGGNPIVKTKGAKATKNRNERPAQTGVTVDRNASSFELQVASGSAVAPENTFRRFTSSSERQHKRGTAPSIESTSAESTDVSTSGASTDEVPTKCKKKKHSKTKEKSTCLKFTEAESGPPSDAKHQKKHTVYKRPTVEDADSESEATSGAVTSASESQATCEKKRAKSVGTSGDSEHETSGSEKRVSKHSKNKKAGKGKETDTDSSAPESASVAKGTTDGDADVTTDGDTSKSATEASAKTTGETVDDHGGWSKSEDALLVSMKEGGETWASIGNQLGRYKKECQKRYSALMSGKASTCVPSNAETTSGDATDDDKGKGKAKAAKGKKGNGSPTMKKASAQQSKAKKGGKKVRIAESDDSDEAADGHSSFREGLARLELSSSSASEAPAPASGLPDLTWEEDLKGQEEYIIKHVYSRMYPMHVSIAPNAHFSQLDQQLLASIDNKMKASKWLEMQANFYNVTGRLIPLELIKAKCEAIAAKEEREKKRVDAKGKRVRDWRDAVSSGGLADPEAGGDKPEDALAVDDDEGDDGDEAEVEED